ncbi:MAG: hypothetical protein RLZZ227_228 [Pseudomonadota bacterium]|jgi:hypothetical protein
MLNQLMKFGMLIATGRFLKQRWRGVLAVLGVWLVLWVVHGEFIRYVELSGNTRYVLQASLLKLALYAFSIGVYAWRVERPLWPKAPAAVTALSPAASAPRQLPAPTRQAAPQSESDDGFDFLRYDKQDER